MFWKISHIYLFTCKIEWSRLLSHSAMERKSASTPTLSNVNWMPSTVCSIQFMGISKSGSLRGSKSSSFCADISPVRPVRKGFKLLCCIGDDRVMADGTSFRFCGEGASFKELVRFRWLGVMAPPLRYRFANSVGFTASVVSWFAKNGTVVLGHGGICNVYGSQSQIRPVLAFCGSRLLATLEYRRMVR